MCSRVCQVVVFLLYYPTSHFPPGKFRWFFPGKANCDRCTHHPACHMCRLRGVACMMLVLASLPSAPSSAHFASQPCGEEVHRRKCPIIGRLPTGDTTLCRVRSVMSDAFPESACAGHRLPCSLLMAVVAESRWGCVRTPVAISLHQPWPPPSPRETLWHWGLSSELPQARKEAAAGTPRMRSPWERGMKCRKTLEFLLGNSGWLWVDNGWCCGGTFRLKST